MVINIKNTFNTFYSKNKIINNKIIVSMGSPLGPLYANYYISHIENKHTTKYA